MIGEINPIKLESWMHVYEAKLYMCLEVYQKDYAYKKEHIPEVCKRMHASLMRGSYNHDSHAFKATCKHFGIPYTRKAIEAYLERNK